MNTTGEAEERGAVALARQMVMGWPVALAIGGAALVPTSVAAAPYTGTGGGPETTVNAPFRAGSGQTVPPGRDAAPNADPTERTQRQKRLDGVLDSICESCRDVR